MAFLLVPAIVSVPDDFRIVCLISAASNSILSLGVWLTLFTGAPDTAKLSVEHISYKTQILDCIKIREFWHITIPFVISVASFNAFSTYLEQFLAPSGYTAAQSGVLGAILIFGGVLQPWVLL